MKGRTIILDHLNGKQAAALMVDGHLDDLFIDTQRPRPGRIYRALADRPVKGQGGMFVKTPDGPAFLRKVKGLSEGQTLLVQVTGMAEPQKAIPVTSKLLFKSRFAIVTPHAPGINLSRTIKDEGLRDRLLELTHAQAGDSGYGLILRSSCADAAADEIADDIAAMLSRALTVMMSDGNEVAILAEGDTPHLAAWREWTAKAEIVTEPGGFERHGVLDEIDLAQRTDVPLGQGSEFFIEPTRALVAVDVNTGKDSSLAAGLKANLACAKTLPRALRVRGLGGQITLDLAPMAKKDRRTFEAALRAAFRADHVETALVGWTPLGHYELQRKRDRLPLQEAMT
ncbi:MAG: ribonuclease E/G [Pseudomonadota bacterium]